MGQAKGALRLLSIGSTDHACALSALSCIAREERVMLRMDQKRSNR
jgi:hypothetical protein